MSAYNDPFYFALPKPFKAGAVEAATKHIEAEFGVSGRTEVVRHEPAFTLCRWNERMILGGDKCRTYVTDPHPTRPQLMLEVWDDGEHTAATRPHEHATWTPRTTLTAVPVGELVAAEGWV